MKNEFWGALGCAMRRILFWIFGVILLSAFPVALHLAAVVVNSKMHDFPAELQADTYLYTCIIAIAATTEMLAEPQSAVQTEAIIAVTAACLCAFCYFASLVTAVTSSPLAPVLTSASNPIAIASLAFYAAHKLPILYVK